MAINNPYVPGDPCSYDLKWMVDRLNSLKIPEEEAAIATAAAEAAAASEEAAKASEEAAALSESSAAGSAESAAANMLRAKEYADDIGDPVGGIVTDWLADNITITPGVVIDTSLSVTGAAADAKATGDIIDFDEDKIENLREYFNIYDPVWEQGGINSSGNDVSATNRVRSQNYLPYYPSGVYFELPAGIVCNVCAYDSTYTFLVRVMGFSDGSVCLFRRSDISFIRIYWTYSDDRNITPEESGKIIVRSYSGTGIINRAIDKKYLTGITTRIEDVSGVSKFKNNLINPALLIDDASVNWSDGITGALTGYILVNKIPVSPNTEYRANYGRNYVFYDASGVYISGAAGQGLKTGVTSPATAAYISYNINKSGDTDDPFLLYFTDSASYDPLTHIDGLGTMQLWTAGKKVNWIGDSIVAGADFDELVCSRLGLVENDYGINGSTIGLKADGTDGRSAICERYSSMDPTADIIIVSGGTNDYQYSWNTIGNIQSHDKKTFYGALNELCEGLISMYPDKVILFTTPIKRAQPFDGVTPTDNFSQNLNGYTLRQYSEIIKEVCDYHSIPCLDLWSESGLNPALASQQIYFDSDLTHPTAAGREIMARRVAGWIASLIVNP